MRTASQPGRSVVLNRSNPLPQLSEEEVRSLLEPAEAVAAIELAFGADCESFVMPARQHLETREGVFLLMPCYSRATGRLGIKLVSVNQERAASATTVEASYLLVDPASAEPQLCLAANWLTDLRTAATSFVATKFLARRDARVLCIFGTGRQARAHLEVFTRMREFEAVAICGSNSANTREFVEAARRDLGISAEAVEAETCVATADIICTCTTASEPLFDGSLLRPGTHLNLVGAFQPERREVDSVTIRRARVAVDTYAGALNEAGDLLIPLHEGAITREHVCAELHEIVTGMKAGRGSREDITVFKSVGCALEDLAVAELIAARPERTPR